MHFRGRNVEKIYSTRYSEYRIGTGSDVLRPRAGSTDRSIGPNVVFAVAPSEVLRSSVNYADGLVISNGVTDGISVRFGEGLTQVRNFRNPSDDDYIAYRHVFAHIYFEAHGKENQDVNTALEFYKHAVSLSEACSSTLRCSLRERPTAYREVIA